MRESSVQNNVTLETQVTTDGNAEALKISEMRYRRLFEAARDGILILDSDQGRITDANPFMTELLGYSHDELLGKELWEIGLLQDKIAGQEAFRQLKQEGYIRYEDLPLENQRGERREVEFVSNLYRENGHTVIQCNIRDITERRGVEARLAAADAAAARHGRQAAVLEERTRLAREIHDTLAQGFAGITAQLEAAEAALANAPEPASPDTLAAHQVQIDKVRIRVGKARDLALASLAQARRSVMALRSPAPEAGSLSESLHGFLDQQALGTAINTYCLFVGGPRPLPQDVEHCLLRVAQEAIANAVAHARAQEISVQVSFDESIVRLRVRDDGQGFDPGLPHDGRFGIVGMRERTKKVGGSLAIVSHPGAGTDVDLSLPYSQKAMTHEEPATDAKAEDA